MKWIAGSRLLNTRLYFNRAARTHVLQVPMDNGTPGTQNTAYKGNIGPTLAQMRHDPAVPDVAEPATISVDADKIAMELGNPRLVNTILLGILSNDLPFEKEQWVDAIKKRVKSKFVEINITALEKGREIKAEAAETAR